MSDEAAFLDALKSNPADDTARLVYADWLDEHDEPRKAEYLRLSTQLPLVGDDVALCSSEAVRVRELGAELDTGWKDTAAGRFDLILFEFNDKVKAIKRVRDVFNVCLSSAKGIVECAPNRLVVRAPFDSALSLRESLTDNTGMALIVRPSGHSTEPNAALFQVVAECTPYEHAGYDPEQWGLDPERDELARWALARLVAAVLKIDQNDALARVKSLSFIPEDRYSAACFLLADDLPLLEAQRVVTQCAPFIENNNRFGIDSYITGRLSPNS